MTRGETPIPPKRFSPSSEDFAVERRKGLREVVEEFQRQHPEVVGFTLYGSLVKTRSPEEALRLRGSAEKAEHQEYSDIDGTLFIDADEVKHLRLYDDIVDAIKRRFATGDSGAELVWNEVQNYYLKIFQKALQQHLNLSPQQVAHIHVKVVSRKIVEELIWSWKFAEVSGERGAGPSDTLVHLFNLAVGRGDAGEKLRGYRLYVLDQLAMAKEGETMWHWLITLVEMEEHDQTVNPQRHYPRTLAEARKVYGKE